MRSIFIAGFVAGVWLLQQQASLPSLAGLIAISFLAVVIVFSRKQLPSFLCSILAFLLAGGIGFYYAAGCAMVRLSDALPKQWEQEEIEIEGVVASLSQVNARGERFRFDVERVISPQTQVEKPIVPVQIKLSYYRYNTWRPIAAPQRQAETRESLFKAGQRWRFIVKLKRPHTSYNPHGYDFEAWALAENIRAMGYIRSQHGMQKLDDFVWRPRYIIESCREKVGQRIARTLSKQHYAGVIQALVIGDHSRISLQDWNIYLRTGTNHLMSISGLHITMLSGLAFSLVAFFWRRFPKLVLMMPTIKAASIGAAFVGLLYACLAGLSVPTQRTLIMLATFAVALLLNKRIAMSQVLMVALLLVVLFDPWAVIAPGFWLSFSALAFIAYTITHRLKTRHWLIAAINTQVAITLGLLPFLIALFGQASFVSPIANALAIPVMSLLVVPLAVFGTLLPFDIVLYGAERTLALCMVILNYLANSPIAVWQQAAPPIWAIALSVLGVCWVMLPRGFPQRWLGILLMLPMLLAQPQPLAQGEMQVAVLDVGQGLAVVVRTAQHVMLYDTGPKYNQENDAGKQVVLPYLRGQGIRKLDALVVSHDDSDHSGGAASLLAQLPVTLVVSSYPLSATHQPMVKQLRCYVGQHWVWDGVQFDVLYPTIESYQQVKLKDNNRSCVIKVTSQYGSVLLTGDIEQRVEQTLLATQQLQLKSDVMIAPHHGSKTSSSYAFVRSVNAKQVIFTVGYLNRFKHPKPTIMQRYLQSRLNENDRTETNTSLYRSDFDGGVLIDFTALRPIQVQTWRSVRRRYWHDKFL